MAHAARVGGDPEETGEFELANFCELMYLATIACFHRLLTSFFRSIHDQGDLTVAFNIRDEEFALPDAKIRAMMKNPAEHGWYDIRTLLGMGMLELAELFRVHADRDKQHLEAVFSAEGRLQRLRPHAATSPLWHTPHTFGGPIGDSTEGPSACARMPPPCNFGTHLNTFHGRIRRSTGGPKGCSRKPTPRHFGTPITRFVTP